MPGSIGEMTAGRGPCRSQPLLPEPLSPRLIAEATRGRHSQPPPWHTVWGQTCSPAGCSQDSPGKRDERACDLDSIQQAHTDLYQAARDPRSPTPQPLTDWVAQQVSAGPYRRLHTTATDIILAFYSPSKEGGMAVLQLQPGQFQSSGLPQA